MDKKIENEKTTSFITTVIKKIRSGETPEAIRVELKEEWSLLNDFFTLYEEKISDINKAVDDWESQNEGRIKESQEFIKDVYGSINPRLEKKIKELLAGIKGIDKKVFIRIKRAYNLKYIRRKEQLDELQSNITYYTKQIRDNLYFLKKVYKHQTAYLKDKGAGQIEFDLEKHSFLYRTLTDELRADRRLKRNMIGFLRLIQLALAIERRSAEYLKEIPAGKKLEELEKYVRRIQDYVGGYRVEEILNPGVGELRIFYGLIEDTFHDTDMLDEIGDYIADMNIRFQRSYHKKWVNHTILLKKDNRIVDGMILDFTGCDPKRNLAIGIIWFYVYAKEHQEAGFPIILNFEKKALENDKTILDYTELGGVYFEIESAKYRLFNLKAKRINMNFPRVDIKYIQPKQPGGKKPVKGLILCFYPIKSEWKYKIPTNEFVNIFREFIIAGGYQCMETPETDLSFLYMLMQLFKKVPDNFYKNPDYTKLEPKKQYVELIY